MCTINLYQIFSETADLPQAGTVFYTKVKDAFDKSENVTVNMADVTALPSIFLNVSIGKIIEEYGTDRLKTGLSFSKITKAQALRLQEYLTKLSSRK